MRSIPLLADNVKSASLLPEVVSPKLLKEVELGQMVGTIDPPHHLVVSPLGVVGSVFWMGALFAKWTLKPLIDYYQCTPKVFIC